MKWKWCWRDPCSAFMILGGRGHEALDEPWYCWWLKSCTACHVLHCSAFDASPCNPHNFNVGMTSRVVQDFSHSWLRLFPAVGMTSRVVQDFSHSWLRLFPAVGMTSRVVQDFSHSWLRLFPAFEYLQGGAGFQPFMTASVSCIWIPPMLRFKGWREIPSNQKWCRISAINRISINLMVIWGPPIIKMYQEEGNHIGTWKIDVVEFNQIVCET